MLRPVRRGLPLLLLGALTGMTSCNSRDSEEAILADCSRANLSTAAVDDCVDRARTMEAAYPSPRLEALLAALDGSGQSQVAELPPPPPDEASPDGSPPDDLGEAANDQNEDFDSTAAPPDYADDDATPVDEDLEGNYALSERRDEGPENDSIFESDQQPFSEDQSSPEGSEPPDDVTPPPPPPN